MASYDGDFYSTLSLSPNQDLGTGLLSVYSWWWCRPPNQGLGTGLLSVYSDWVKTREKLFFDLQTWIRWWWKSWRRLLILTHLWWRASKVLGWKIGWWPLWGWLVPLVELLWKECTFITSGGLAWRLWSHVGMQRYGRWTMLCVYRTVVHIPHVGWCINV